LLQVFGSVLDADGDGIADDADNCPDIVNPDQADADEDGIGDVIEFDTDGDGIESSAAVYPVLTLLRSTAGRQRARAFLKHGLAARKLGESGLRTHLSHTSPCGADGERRHGRLVACS